MCCYPQGILELTNFIKQYIVFIHFKYFCTYFNILFREFGINFN